MIFDGYFNESILMILASEKKNRNEVKEFIDSFPFELYDKLNVALALFDEYERENVDVLSRDIYEVSEKLYFSNNYMYWFSVDMLSGSLNIGRSINGVNEIDITLYSGAAYDIENYRNLGYINYGNSNMIYYEYFNTIFGGIVVSLENGRKRKYTKIDENILNSVDKKKHSRVRIKI